MTGYVAQSKRRYALIIAILYVFSTGLPTVRAEDKVENTTPLKWNSIETTVVEENKNEDNKPQNEEDKSKDKSNEKLQKQLERQQQDLDKIYSFLATQKTQQDRLFELLDTKEKEKKADKKVQTPEKKPDDKKTTENQPSSATEQPAQTAAAQTVSEVKPTASSPDTAKPSTPTIQEPIPTKIATPVLDSILAEMCQEAQKSSPQENQQVTKAPENATKAAMVEPAIPTKASPEAPKIVTPSVTITPLSDNNTTASDQEDAKPVTQLTRPAAAAHTLNSQQAPTQQANAASLDQSVVDVIADEEAQTYSRENDVRSVTVEQQSPRVITKIVYVDRPQPPASSVTESDVARKTTDYIADNTQTSQDAITKEAEVNFFYYPGGLYKINTQDGWLTDVRMQPGETILTVLGGDTSRWMIDQATSGSGADKQAHVYIKPLKPGLSTNIIINTDRHSYQLLVKSGSAERPVPMVAWTYPQETKAAFFRQKEAKQKKDNNEQPMSGSTSVEKLNFNYTIKKGESYSWRPKTVFDDGKKTYLQMPAKMSVTEAPVIFILNNKKKPVLVNYRVKGSYYIVDRLFKTAEMRCGTDEIVRIIRNGDITSEDYTETEGDQ